MKRVQKRVFFGYVRNSDGEFIIYREQAVWRKQTISSILLNEKYIVNVLLQKTYIKDFFEGKQVNNKGKIAQYYVENCHEGIISKELFDTVQIMKSHVEEQKDNANEYINRSTRRRKNSLSGKVVCGFYGHTYRRITRSDGVIVWMCGNRVDNGRMACSE